MYSEKLIITRNWQDIERAKELGMPEPDTQTSTTKILFWKEDVKRVVIDDDKLMVEFHDKEAYQFKFDEKMWNELKEFFEENEE